MLRKVLQTCGNTHTLLDTRGQVASSQLGVVLWDGPAAFLRLLLICCNETSPVVWLVTLSLSAYFEKMDACLLSSTLLSSSTPISRALPCSSLHFPGAAPAGLGSTPDVLGLRPSKLVAMGEGLVNLEEVVETACEFWELASEVLVRLRPRPRKKEEKGEESDDTDERFVDRDERFCLRDVSLAAASFFARCSPWSWRSWSVQMTSNIAVGWDDARFQVSQ